MNKLQTYEKIKTLRENIQEIYRDGAPFIRYSAVKMENEIKELISNYITNNLGGTIENVTENDINDLIELFCEKNKVTCTNFIKDCANIKFDIIFAQSDRRIDFYEFEDILKTFEFANLDIEHIESDDLKNQMVKYSFMISDNWEYIFEINK